ncbi:unnamed protein product [Thelazia callipaeda]|uniref:THAP-type domain-containing protein n=1 Tax=Thelazia callipaeda TaxID=103827 RepID=A0A0N5CVS5_THECL|nr:unnamed protein product [Thelazia callipaeda]
MLADKGGLGCHGNMRGELITEAINNSRVSFYSLLVSIGLCFNLTIVDVLKWLQRAATVSACLMPTTCGFPNCKFRSRYRGQEDNRHFYRIPKRPQVLRQRWLLAIGRTEDTVVSQVRIIHLLYCFLCINTCYHVHERLICMLSLMLSHRFMIEVSYLSLKSAYREEGVRILQWIFITINMIVRLSQAMSNFENM